MTSRRTLNRSMSEAALQAAVIECAERLGWRVYHTHDSRRSQPGYPDLTMVRHGHIIFAELKSAHGRLRKEQEAWLDDLLHVQLTTHGVARMYVWYPDDWSSGLIEDVLSDAKGERA